MKIALLFPGQGSQTVGMGQDFVTRFPCSEEVFRQADQILGFPLSKLCFEGPQEELNLTVNTQPALLTVSAAIATALRQSIEIHPVFVAGHSLGEYSALWYSGCLEFASAVQLVRIRGQAMQTASPTGVGTMAAVLGLSESQIQELVDDNSKGQVLQAANFNGPGQIVISGHKEAVERAMSAAKSMGAKKCVLLPVSAPFHCKLMQPAADVMAQSLKTHSIGNLQIPVVNNADAKPLENNQDAVINSLIRQITAPVKWDQSIRYISAQGVQLYIELGAGRVLANLVKRISPDIECISVSDVSGFDALIERLNQGI